MARPCPDAGRVDRICPQNRRKPDDRSELAEPLGLVNLRLRGDAAAGREAAAGGPAVASRRPSKKPAARRPRPAAAPAASWDSIASQLGVTPAPEPVAPRPAAAAAGGRRGGNRRCGAAEVRAAAA